MHELHIKRNITSPILEIEQLNQYTGKSIELIFFVKEKQRKRKNKVLATNFPARAILTEYKNPKLKKFEKSAWERAVTDDYEIFSFDKKLNKLLTR